MLFKLISLPGDYYHHLLLSTSPNISYDYTISNAKLSPQFTLITSYSGNLNLSPTTISSYEPHILSHINTIITYLLWFQIF